MKAIEVVWKTLWVIFILLNLFDLVFSAVAWKTGHGLIEENFFVSYAQYYGEINVPFYLAVMILIGVKLLFFTGVYWFTRLFDLLKAGKYKWIALIPFIGISILINLQNVLLYFYNIIL